MPRQTKAIDKATTRKANGLPLPAAMNRRVAEPEGRFCAINVPTDKYAATDVQSDRKEGHAGHGGGISDGQNLETNAITLAFLEATPEQRAAFVANQKIRPTLLAELKRTEPHAAAAEITKDEQLRHAAILSTQPSELPNKAPTLWDERSKLGYARRASPAEFIMQVYGPWIGRIALVDIRDLDPSLAQRYSDWVNKGNKEPDGFVLPRHSRAARREIKQLRQAHS